MRVDWSAHFGFTDVSELSVLLPQDVNSNRAIKSVTKSRLTLNKFKTDTHGVMDTAVIPSRCASRQFKAFQEYFAIHCRPMKNL
jgi:ferritin-like protein